MSELETLESRLRAILNKSDIAVTGAVQVINLERMRDHLDLSSEKKLQKAQTIVQSVIDRHLAPSDLGMWLSDLVYVLIFGGVKLAESDMVDFKVRMIATEISRRLMGNQADKLDFVRTTSVPIKAIKQFLGQKTASEEANSPTNSIEPPWQAFGLTKDFADAPPNTSPEQDSTPDIEPNWQEFGRSSPPPEGLMFNYQPIWDVKNKGVSTYLCVASHSSPHNNSANTAEAILLKSETDLLLLKRVVSDLERLHKIGRRVLMACPLHVMTLSVRRSRDQFVQTYHPLSEEIQRDIIFELVGEWNGMPQSRMLSLIACVKPVSRSVTALVDLEWNRFDLLRDGGIVRASVDLTHRTEGEEKLLPLMENFVERASKGGLKTCAHGLSSQSLAVAALGAGFDLVEGQAIHGTVDTPEHIFRFNVGNLFSDLLSGLRNSH